MCLFEGGLLEHQVLHLVPFVFLFDFKRPAVHVDLNAEAAAEVIWHSPRVPADAASAVFHGAGVNNPAPAVMDADFRFFGPLVIFLQQGSVDASIFIHQLDADPAGLLLVNDVGPQCKRGRKCKTGLAVR